MAGTEAGSTVPRRQLGRYLSELRTRAGLTVRDAARELERSTQTIWRVENGLVSSRAIEVEGMCRLYGATKDMTRALCALAKETKAKGWWQSYGDVVPEWFDLYVGLEGAASRLFFYGQERIPGLFQTDDYARTLIRADHPDEDAAEIERRVELRMARQKLIRRPIDPPALQVALNESVLRWPIGGAEVMATQLRQLAGASELPNVAVRVVPFSAGLHPGILSGSFIILRFPLNGNGAESEPPTVYSDIYTGAIYLDRPHEVERYAQASGDIWKAALDETESRNLLLAMAEELR
jgi:transcriptional regulator with XRE-family HTH domain